MYSLFTWLEVHLLQSEHLCPLGLSLTAFDHSFMETEETSLVSRVIMLISVQIYLTMVMSARTNQQTKDLLMKVSQWKASVAILSYDNALGKLGRIAK